MLGVTRRYGAPGPRFRRSDAGLLASRAQSSGDRPGSRITLRDGFAGLLLCEGGGASVDVPGCRSYECCGCCRLGMGPRDGTPRRELPLPPALLMALRAGGRGGGAIDDSCDGAANAADSEGEAGAGSG